MKRYFIFTTILFFLVASCAPKPNPEIQIKLAVAQTLAAIPTYTSYPTLRIPPIPPTATPMNLSGLFCEYQFCIGHPVSISFFDLNAKDNPQAPSSISQGKLVAYDPTLVILVIWQDAAGASDASFMLDTIIESNVDARSGDLKAFQVGDLNVDYVPITTTAPSFTNGGAAAWMCGSRAFAWKAYTPQAELATSLLNEALQKFQCNSQ